MCPTLDSKQWWLHLSRFNLRTQSINTHFNQPQSNSPLPLKLDVEIKGSVKTLGDKRYKVNGFSRFFFFFLTSASYKQLCYTFRNRPKHTTVINYKHTLSKPWLRLAQQSATWQGWNKARSGVVYSLCFVGLTAGEMWMWLLGVLHKPGHSWLPHSRTLLPRGLPASDQVVSRA